MQRVFKMVDEYGIPSGYDSWKTAGPPDSEHDDEQWDDECWDKVELEMPNATQEKKEERWEELREEERDY
tara:strand:+ start:421 stop:630 length:210 start_codon:yes stop_codon:yes gene_type:complete